MMRYIVLLFVSLLFADNLHAQCSLVKGFVFADQNRDCQFNVIRDNGLSGILVAARQNVAGQTRTIFARTNDQGFYKFCLPGGVYQLHIARDSARNHIWVDSCFGIRQIFVDTNRVDTQLHLFALSNGRFRDDQAVGLYSTSGTKANMGFTHRYFLELTNRGSLSKSVDLNLDYHKDFVVKSISIAPVTLNSGNMQWKGISLAPGERKTILIDLVTPLSLALGTEVSFRASLQSHIDGIAMNDSSTLKQTIVAAIDPNNKLVSPQGNITPETEEIFYQINFQNTGTETAVRVKVVDTIDLNLPIKGIVIHAASHPYSFKIENQTFIWTFDDINLPDSASNEPASHGFIFYSARIIKGLAVGDSITNRAHIYFDFQESLPTNETITIIAEEIPNNPREENLRIFPVPASDYIQLEYSGKELVSTFVIRNVLGQIIETKSITMNTYLETTNYSSGVYTISNGKNKINKKFIIAH